MNHATNAMAHETKIRRVDYFYSAAVHRLRGALWPSFAPARIAGVSNPFVTLEQLKMQLVQDKRTVPWVNRITQAYRKRWREVILDDAIEQALALVPLIAIATQIWSRKDWVLSEQRHDPGAQSYLRSLMRHMSRAAESPTILRALSA
jgi:hypothetical protein